MNRDPTRTPRAARRNRRVGSRTGHGRYDRCLPSASLPSDAVHQRYPASQLDVSVRSVGPTRQSIRASAWIVNLNRPRRVFRSTRRLPVASLASPAAIPDPIAMLRLLDSLGYQLLVPLALILGLAPFVPEPHLVEKIRMLFQGTLQRPIDIFDLFLHATPIILLLTKVVADLLRRGRA